MQEQSVEPPAARSVTAGLAVRNRAASSDVEPPIHQLDGSALPPGITAGKSAEVPGGPMTTTDDLALPDSAQVVPLADRRRRRAHLEHLLDVRSRLAVTAAEQRSHDLPEKWETTRLLYQVEETIHEGWPDVYDRQLASWAEQDAALMHTLHILQLDCSLCRVIADSHHINLEPPNAA